MNHGTFVPAGIGYETGLFTDSFPIICPIVTMLPLNVTGLVEYKTPRVHGADNLLNPKWR